MASSMKSARRSTWLAFAVLGVADGLVLLELPSGGILILLLALAGIVARSPRAAAFAGLTSGVGGMWVGLLLWSQARCDAFNSVPGQSCESPGIEGWIVTGVGILVVGIAASIAVLLRARDQLSGSGTH